MTKRAVDLSVYNSSRPTGDRYRAESRVIITREFAADSGFRQVAQTATPTAHEVARVNRQSRLRLSYFTSTYQSHRLLVLEAHDLDRFDFLMISIQTGKYSALCRCDRNFGERGVGLTGRYLNMYATLSY